MCVYTISQVSDKIGVSRQSIYNKLDKEDLQGYVKKTERGKIITEEGIKILELMFSKKTVKNNIQFTEKQSKVDTNLNQNLQYENHMNSLNKEIETLKQVVNEKDKQIDNLTRLIENNQILLKQQQVLMIESKEQKQTGFWKKLFN